MKRSSGIMLLTGMVLCAGAALGTQTPQEKCDQARVTAWKTYVACIDKVVGTVYGCQPTKSCKADMFAAFAKCRHTYFKNWTTFRGRKSLTGSTCVASRFTSTDSDATVTDALTGLVWEKKTGSLGNPEDSNPENVVNIYTWSTGSSKEDGTAFTTFLTAGVNTPGFAGANGWRVPTLAELQTILLDFPCTGPTFGPPTCVCGVLPACIDPTFGVTAPSAYWSATSYVPAPSFAWTVNMGGAAVIENDETVSTSVRAVRGGL